MSLAIVRWIAGPVLHAVKQGPFSLRESVRVGPQALLGEVVRIHDDEIVVQVYEDTTGLRPGIEVHGDGQPLAIRLGPGLLGRIFDGLLRPLSGTASAFVQPGMRSGAAGRWHFEPRIGAGALLAPGAVIGEAASGGAAAARSAAWRRPMSAASSNRWWRPASTPTMPTVCVLRQGDGRRRELAMSHVWPVRTPRPVRAARAGAGAAGHRPAHPRLPVPGGAGRQGGDPRRLRHRQDGAARSAGQGLQRRRHRLPRLRRARQRDGRRARRVPARSPTRAPAGR